MTPLPVPANKERHWSFGVLSTPEAETTESGEGSIIVATGVPA